MLPPYSGYLCTRLSDISAQTPLVIHLFVLEVRLMNLDLFSARKIFKNCKFRDRFVEHNFYVVK
jgi:hypothetical protein